MIPATHWHLNDDGTAWWVVRECGGVKSCSTESWCRRDVQDSVLPCYSCWGHRGDDISPPYRCQACAGSGRHTFELEVAPDWAVPDRNLPVTPITYLTSVERVLPIVDSSLIGKHADGDEQRMWLGRGDVHTVTMPEAAEPGMWAALLRIHGGHL